MGIFNKLEKLKLIKSETKSALVKRGASLAGKVYEQYSEEISNIEGVEDAELIADEILGEQL